MLRKADGQGIDAGTETAEELKKPHRIKEQLSPANLYVLLFFAFLSLLLTYPLVHHISSRILGDPGDPLLNTWILGWNIKHFLDFDFANLFNGNFFYPHTNTLAYSEHLLFPALIGMPIMVTTGNPILTYNIIFLAGMTASAFGMYLLAHYFIGEKFPSIFAGLVFGFFPFHFAHIGHLQMQMAFGLPLALLYLHRYMESPRFSFLTIFTGFVILQFLSCGYFSIFLLVCIATVVAVEIFRKRISISTLSRLTAAVILAGLILIPVFAPYFTVKNHMGFVRTLRENAHFSATLISYFSVGASNNVWGSITRGFCKPETELFLGAIPLALAIVGLVKGRVVNGATIWPTYPILMAVGFLLSLGPKISVPGTGLSIPGLHLIFYKCFPGFNGLRVPARAAIIVALCASLFAALGVKHLVSFFKGRQKTILAVTLASCIILEYCHLPVQTTRIETGRKVPAVYKWLQGQKDEAVILELPMPKGLPSAWKETRYMYFSLYHWKRLINGYSGYFPADYIALLASMSDFPTDRSIQYLKTVGVDYIIVHTDAFDNKQGPLTATNIGNFRDQTELIGRFGSDIVYRLKNHDENRDGSKQLSTILGDENG